MTALTNPPRRNPTYAAEAMLEACQELVTNEVLPHVGQWDRDDVLPAGILERIGEIGVPGALVPARYGGPELSVSEMVDVWRTLAQGWISLTGAVNTTHLGTVLLVRNGTQAQRAKWLPRIASGEVWASFSITEPNAGSDLQYLSTTAEPAEDGLIITGQKRWIAGGKSFPVTFMLAREPGVDRPSCVVLPSEGRDSDTWKVEMLDKLGYRGVESAAWQFDHHHAVGAEILGGDAGHGRGVSQMIDALAVGRVNVACRALGIIDRAIVCALAEATGRRIGQGVLGDHTHAMMRVGELRARQRMVESLVAQAAQAIDLSDPEAGEIAMCAKVTASEAAVWCADCANRLAASRSYTWDSELARLTRDAPQTQIGEGANDSLLLAIGRGLIRQRNK